MQNPVFLARLRAPFAFISALSLVVSGFAAIPASFAFADTEILNTANPGFETMNSAGAPTGWTKGTFLDTGATMTSVLSTTTDAHTGNVAGKVVVSAVSGSAEARWTLSTPIAVTAGQLYNFTDWYKSTVLTSVFIYPNVGGSQWIGDASPQANWTEFHGSYLVPAGVTSITIGHAVSQIGTLTTDDYSLMLSSAPTTFSQGMVTLTFDDGWDSFYEVASSSLNAHNFKATNYIITGVNGSNLGSNTPNPGYMSKAQILKLQTAGYDIEAHTRAHLDLAKDDPLTHGYPGGRPAMWLGEINGSKTDLTSNGFPTANNFAYPYGSYCAPNLSDCTSTTVQTAGAVNVLKAVKDAGFIAARSVDQGYNLFSDLTNDNKFKLKMQHVTDTTTAADIQGWINFARDNKVWLIVMFHNVRGANVTSGATGLEASGSLNPDCVEPVTDANGDEVVPPQTQRDTDCTSSKVLSDAMDYLATVPTTGTGSVSVKTMKEVLALDVTAPVLTLPASPMNVLNSSASGIAVTFTATATDDKDASPAVACTPASGTTFPVGDTTVNCTATDASGNATNGSFVIHVTANNVPVAEAQSVTTASNNPVTITLTGSDADNDSLIFSTTTNPAHGTLSLSGVSAVYTPETSFIGADSFDFVVFDGTATSTAATISITVTDIQCPEGTRLDNHACLSNTPTNGGGGSGGGGGGGGGGGVVGLIGNTSTGGQVLGASTQALTDAQIAAIINLLKSFSADQSVIDAVNASLHGQASGGTTTPGKSDGFIFTQTLQVGSTGNQVTELQKRLTVEGVYSGPVTGTFGPLTKAGVVAYQKAHSIPQVGIVGPQTRAVLNGTI